MVDETNFVLVNIYNSNNELEQVTTLLDLGKMLKAIKDFSDKHIVLAGDFFFDTSLDQCGGKPTLKKKSIAKFTELKEKFDLCDIWRIRNPKTKRYTFRQKHVSGLIQRRLIFLIPCKSLSKILTFQLPSQLITHQVHFHIVKMKKAIGVEVFGNLIIA